MVRLKRTGPSTWKTLKHTPHSRCDDHPVSFFLYIYPPSSSPLRAVWLQNATIQQLTTWGGAATEQQACKTPQLRLSTSAFHSPTASASYISQQHTNCMLQRTHNILALSPLKTHTHTPFYIPIFPQVIQTNPVRHTHTHTPSAPEPLQ